MNLHPLVWGDQAEEFHPDRWDYLTGDAASAYAFEAFHNGPRMCIGRNLTSIEMKIFLLEMVTRFEIRSADQNKELEVAGPTFTLRPKNKLQVRLSAISKLI